jgi:hypothetical protein
MKAATFLACASSAGMSPRVYYRVFDISSIMKGHPAAGLDLVPFFSTLTFMTSSSSSARADGVGRE